MHADQLDKKSFTQYFKHFWSLSGSPFLRMNLRKIDIPYEMSSHKIVHMNLRNAHKLSTNILGGQQLQQSAFFTGAVSL